MFTIPLDRLLNGKTHLIDQKISSDFMHLNEKDLIFKDPITIKGKAYLAQDDIILSINIYATSKITCSICNELTDFAINIENLYITQEIKELENFWDYQEHVREIILLEIPPFLECNDGHCSKREQIDPYLKDEKEDYYPFKELK